MAGAYLGVGEPDAVINVGVSGPGVVKKAIDRARAANPAADLGQLVGNHQTHGLQGHARR